jgi:hypothetical protein
MPFSDISRQLGSICLVLKKFKAVLFQEIYASPTLSFSHPDRAYRTNECIHMRRGTRKIGMPRVLNDRDKAILSLLAPEMEDRCCEGSGHEFQSILPPVSNHFARDEQDFAERIARLSKDDLEYLATRILDGSESMGCMPPEDVDSLVALLEDRVSSDLAKRVRNAYGAEECENLAL